MEAGNETSTLTCFFNLPEEDFALIEVDEVTVIPEEYKVPFVWKLRVTMLLRRLRARRAPVIEETRTHLQQSPQHSLGPTFTPPHVTSALSSSSGYSGVSFTSSLSQIPSSSVTFSSVSMTSASRATVSDPTEAPSDPTTTDANLTLVIRGITSRERSTS
jgi:hypothetical protein